MNRSKCLNLMLNFIGSAAIQLLTTECPEKISCSVEKCDSLALYWLLHIITAKVNLYRQRTETLEKRERETERKED